MFRQFKCLKKVECKHITIQVGDIVEVQEIQIINNMPNFLMEFCDEAKPICGYSFRITLKQLIEGSK